MLSQDSQLIYLPQSNTFIYLFFIIVFLNHSAGGSDLFVHQALNTCDVMLVQFNKEESQTFGLTDEAQFAGLLPDLLTASDKGT